MLDKIEVETEYQAGNLKFRVTAVGDTLVTGYWEDNDEEEVSVSKAGAISFWEPLPSPESPVDDVIWEWEGEVGYCPVRILATGEVKFHHDPEWAGTGNQCLIRIAKFAADLYARLNPPLPQLPDGEWERVSFGPQSRFENGDHTLSDQGDGWIVWGPNAGDDFARGFANGVAQTRGWVMRRKTTTVEEWPKIGEMYWLAMPTNRDYCSHLDWCGDSGDRMWKERGLIFKTEEEAIAKAKKMVEGMGK